MPYLIGEYGPLSKSYYIVFRTSGLVAWGLTQGYSAGLVIRGTQTAEEHEGRVV